MHQLAIIFKSLLVFCIAVFTESIITGVMLLSFIPAPVKEFFEEVKTPIAVLVSFSIFILTVIKIAKSVRKDTVEKQEKD